MTTRDRLVLNGVAAGVTLAVLAPLFWPGYVLSYDMVFVPHQPLRWELVAPTTGLPRAVPQDAVVSVLSLVVPGWLIQRVALVGAVYAAALGAGRLVPSERLLTRVVAAVGYAWTPFLAERLLLGQWGLLLAYGALPWLVSAAIGVRQGAPGWLPRLVVSAAICAITPTGGLIALATTLVLTVGPPFRSRVGRGPLFNKKRLQGSPAYRQLVAGGVVLGLNAPWIVAALSTAAPARSDPAGVAVFAVRAENWAGPLVSVAGTGGIWNRDTTPVSRSSVLVPVVTVALLALAIWGFAVLRRRWPGGAANRLLVLAAGGVVLALLGTTGPTAAVLTWAVDHLPGAGLVRDGHKFLAPYALLLVLGVALGAERLASRLALPRARVLLVAAAILPVSLMPDLAGGGGGQLVPVRYPADWPRVAQIIADRPGEVLALPFSEYRVYGWNRGRVVIDPAPRYLPADVLIDDRLRVGDVVLAGEDPRAAGVRELLAAGRSVGGTGVAWVLVQHGAGGIVAPTALEGLRLVYDGAYLDLYANASVISPPPSPSGPPPLVEAPAAPAGRRWLIVSAYVLAVALTIVALWRLRGRATPW